MYTGDSIEEWNAGDSCLHDARRREERDEVIRPFRTNDKRLVTFYPNCLAGDDTRVKQIVHTR